MLSRFSFFLLPSFPTCGWASLLALLHLARQLPAFFFRLRSEFLLTKKKTKLESTLYPSSSLINHHNTNKHNQNGNTHGGLSG